MIIFQNGLYFILVNNTNCEVNVLAPLPVCQLFLSCDCSVADAQFKLQEAWHLVFTVIDSIFHSSKHDLTGKLKPVKKRWCINFSYNIVYLDEYYLNQYYILIFPEQYSSLNLPRWENSPRVTSRINIQVMIGCHCFPQSN